MEIKIVISDSSVTGQASDTGTQAGAAIQPTVMQRGGGVTHVSSIDTRAFGGRSDASHAEGAHATYPDMAPSEELLRAAAAIGAHDAGPAPMVAFGTPSAPQPFTYGTSQSGMGPAASGDAQAAGAAPGSGMYMPTHTVASTDGET